MARRDTFLRGFLPAAVFPFGGAVIFYLLFFGYMQFESFLDHIVSTSQWISVLSLGVILNLALFFLFIRSGADRSARGVLGATFLYAFLVVYFKAF